MAPPTAAHIQWPHIHCSIMCLCLCAATKVVNNLVTKLPSDGHQKTPSSEVVVNICGILNNLVTSTSVAARDVSYFDGLPKLVGIKTSHDNR